MGNIIGVDPGQKGGIVVIDGKGNPLFAEPMPVSKEHEFQYKAIINIFKKYPKSLLAIEQVGYMGSETVSGITDLCYHAGVIFGIAVSLGMNVVHVSPREWKPKIGLPKVGIKSKPKTETSEEKRQRMSDNYHARKVAKSASIEHATNLFPKIANKCNKVTDGIADAVLIAEYVRRNIE